MSSSQKETPEEIVAGLAKGFYVGIYQRHCDTIEENKNHPLVKRYWAATKTYDATKGKDKVKNFISARGRKASKKELDKLRKENKDIGEFETAEKDKNDLAQETHVKSHRNATDAKESMEKKNEEVIAYHKAIDHALFAKEKREAAKLLLQPSGSSTGSTRNPRNAGDGNGTQNRPLVGKLESKTVLNTRLRNEEDERHQREQREQREKATMLAAMVAATLASDSSENTSRDRPRHGSRDRSNPPTGSKPPASASKELQRNSGRHRVPSPHTHRELHFDAKGKDDDESVDIVMFKEKASREKARERERARERARQMERAKR
ncbi:hypothetical protein BOTNAR_0105g00260 [Botryotinia narcissicola]|uniref:Uncharacterized protein n=1 Tax=Botryotinia narcissicola TaxID=278944 RepID=A0A4Z1INS1_9HELO|nr:hypothetical protein BOTNAR_0105g00260 [Botryotinia narcissicola]